MNKITREAGGFYYEQDAYGNKRPTQVSLGTEVTDGLIAGFPIAFKICWKLNMALRRVLINLVKAIFTSLTKKRENTEE